MSVMRTASAATGIAAQPPLHPGLQFCDIGKARRTRFLLVVTFQAIAGAMYDFSGMVPDALLRFNAAAGSGLPKRNCIVCG